MDGLFETFDDYPLVRVQLTTLLTSTVKRFGEYVVNLNRPPEPWIKEVVVQFKPAMSQPSAVPLVKEA